MPSPFPGMDPYLESPRWFPSFHDEFIVYLKEELQPKLPPSYYAMSGQRVWVEVSGRRVIPDVSVAKSPNDANPAVNSLSEQGAVALAVPPAEPVVVTVVEEELHESYLNIYAGDEGDKLVASLELLSLANKNAGEHNRDRYLRKQREMLQSQVHLIEIDLLRAGPHTTAVPEDQAIAECGRFDYHVSLRPFDRSGVYLVYPILLNSPLPSIDIPLLPGEQGVKIDLQKVFTRTYDVGPYRRLIPYQTSEPASPLSPTQAQWARNWLASENA